jgi:bacterioferritin-associated ferredoxin
VYACICHAVPADDVAASIHAGAHDEETVGEVTGAGTSCGGCLDRICEMLRDLRGDPLPDRELQRAG